MEKWRFERAKKALKDYDKIDIYIKEIEESIRIPYKETDLAADRKGTRTDNDPFFNSLWTIETNRKLVEYKKTKKAVKELLDECDSDTETIIQELFIRKWKRYTMQGLVEQHIIKCGRNKAIELRDKFFDELLEKLGY